MKKYLVFILALISTLEVIAQDLNSNRIQPYQQNRMYWQYEGQPILLIGGSNDDNLFQWTGKTLTDHLDLLVSVGGNYVRNVMSDRDEGNIFAFKKTKDGLYDLNTWNEEYWKRLEFFLEETAKRKVFVHLTLWDQYDIRAKAYEMKDSSPWNPKSNINYTESEFGQSWEDFFHTAEKGNQKVLSFQRRFINRVLNMSLEYGHVIYNICNEGFTSFRWDNYWAQFIKETAEAKGIKAQVTAMQIDAEATVRLVLGTPELYTFSDISQNNQDALGTSGAELINSVSANQAYCMGNPGVEYAIYLPEGGSVVLDPFVYTDEVEVRWFDVKNAAFSNPEIYPVHWSAYPGMLKTQRNKGSVFLTAPTTNVFTYRNQWIALIKINLANKYDANRK